MSQWDEYPAAVTQIAELTGDGYALVELDGALVPAYLPDHVLVSEVNVGTRVTVLRVMGGYQVIAVFSGPSAGGGMILGPNLLPNSGFELGGEQPDGWPRWGVTTYFGFSYPTDSMTVRDTTPGEALGGVARSLQTLDAGVDVQAVTVHAAPVAVDPGSTYRVSAWVKAYEVTPDLECSLVVTASGPGSSSSFIAASVVAPGLAYQMLAGDVTIPAGCDAALLYLRSVSNHPTELQVSWDTAAFQQRVT